jgi:gluconokinase
VPLHLVFMGVSGSGKSAVGHPAAQRLGMEWTEGDDHHPQANIDKMSSGTPLTDEDRWPWLEELHAWTLDADRAGRPTGLTCSALRRSYRDVLRRDLADQTWFVHLVGDRALLEERMSNRDHFMPPSLLDSQLDTLEPLEDDEQSLVLDVSRPLEELVEDVVSRFEGRLSP